MTKHESGTSRRGRGQARALAGRAALLGLVLAGRAEPTVAQDLTLSEMLPKLIAQGAVLSPDHQSHFVIGATLTSVPAQLNAALALQVSDFPLGPTNGGMLFSSGSPDSARSDAHHMFGSAIADRGVPLGRGRIGLAMTYQDTNYGSFENADIKGGGINFLFAHAPSALQSGGGDVLQETVYVRLNRKVVGFLLNYGATDRLDLDIVVPVVQVALDARIYSRILRASTSQDPSIHNFDPTLGVATHTTYLNVSLSQPGLSNYGVDGLTARGLGDLVMRGKLALVANPERALAATVDLSLPTGNADNFLGTGAVRVKPGLVASAVFGRVSPHASGGYTFSHGSLSSKLQPGFGPELDLHVPDELDWSAGLDVAVAPHVTLVSDAIGRSLRNVQRFATGTTIFATGAPGVPQDVAAGTDLIATSRGQLNQAFGAVGGRVNLGGSVFANATVLFPVVQNGLKPKSTVVFGIDYGF